jgi:hypothetical protein
VTFFMEIIILMTWSMWTTRNDWCLMTFTHQCNVAKTSLRGKPLCFFTGSSLTKLVS